jgi:hypothetical protein
MFDQGSTMTATQAFFSGLGQFTGIFLGVIAGTAVTIVANSWSKRSNEKTQISNLRFELDLNRKKTIDWLKEVKRYRDSVNGDAIQNYWGFFKFSSAIGVTMFQMHQSGLLYQYLTHDEIGQLQEMFNDYSSTGEQYFNNQITQNRQLFVNTSAQIGYWQKEIKPKVVSEIDFLENQLNNHLQHLSLIIDKLAKVA